MQVAEGIYQVQLPLPFALRIVNCYLLRDGDGWTIVDCGLNYAPGQAAWRAAFEELGVEAGAIRRIILTLCAPRPLWHGRLAGRAERRAGAALANRAGLRRAGLGWRRGRSTALPRTSSSATACPTTWPRQSTTNATRLCFCSLAMHSLIVRDKMWPCPGSRPTRSESDQLIFRSPRVARCCHRSWWRCTSNMFEQGSAACCRSARCVLVTARDGLIALESARTLH